MADSHRGRGRQSCDGHLKPPALGVQFSAVVDSLAGTDQSGIVRADRPGRMGDKEDQQADFRPCHRSDEPAKHHRGRWQLFLPPNTATKELWVRRFTGVVVMATFAVGALPAAVAYAAGPRPPMPQERTCAGKSGVASTSYVIACADTNVHFGTIHRSISDVTSTSARRTYVQDPCKPACATDPFAKYPEVLTRSRPMTKHGQLSSVVSHGYAVSASATLPFGPLPVVATPPTTRKECSPDSEIAAGYIVPPAPFKARVVWVRQAPVPVPSSLGASYEYPLRLYRVSFHVMVGNAVLPAGHTYVQFAYVGQPMPPAGRWCFVAGGSGP
jgi:hypothetical protein